MNALRCLGDLVPSLDKEGILGILETVRRCTAVDHTAPTLMCTLGVANAIYKQVSLVFLTCSSLPLLNYERFFPMPFTSVILNLLSCH